MINGVDPGSSGPPVFVITAAALFSTAMTARYRMTIVTVTVSLLQHNCQECRPIHVRNKGTAIYGTETTLG